MRKSSSSGSWAPYEAQVEWICRQCWLGKGAEREERFPWPVRPASKVPPYMWRSRGALCRVSGVVRLFHLVTRVIESWMYVGRPCSV